MRITEYAAHRDCGLQAVQFAIARGRIRVTDANLIDSEEADAAWEENTEAAMAHAGPKPIVNSPAKQKSERERSTVAVPGITYTDARALREVYDAQRKQLELDLRRGLYVRKDEVEQAQFKLYRMLRDACFNLPPRLAPQLAAETDSNAIHELLEAELHRIFSDFAEGRLT